MRITKVALAGYSDLLYHATKTETLLEILKEDKIRMSPDLGAEYKLDSKMQKSNKFRPYFLSLSRVKFGGYARTIKPESLAIIALDGQKLKTKYAGEPVDYWGPSYRNIETRDTEQRMKYNENEDRIYSDHPYLEPLSKYVLGIHVMLKPEYAKFQTDRENTSDEELTLAFSQADTYKSIQRTATIHHIKTYFYTSFNDLKLLNTRKAITDIYVINYEADINKVNEVLELILNDDRDLTKLSKSARDIVYNIKYYTKYLDFLKNAIHNSKSDLIGRTAIDRLVAYMRRFKVRSIPELEALMKKKLLEWEKL